METLEGTGSAQNNVNNSELDFKRVGITEKIIPNYRPIINTQRKHCLFKLFLIRDLQFTEYLI